MSTLTVTAKGQVTLRKDLLEHLGVWARKSPLTNFLTAGSK
jgi:hypothetical protein